MKLFRLTTHVLSIGAPFALLIGCASAAQSQPPQIPKPDTAQQIAKPDQRGTHDSPVFVDVLPAKKTPEQTAKDEAKEQEQREDRGLTQTLSKLTLAMVFLQFVAICAQAYLAHSQNMIMASQSTIMGRQRRIMRNQRITNDAILATNREIERAYITFGHRNVRVKWKNLPTPTPETPNLVGPPKPIYIDIEVSITNIGRTPGSVLGGFFGYVIGEKPGIPDITRGMPNGFGIGFLLPRKFISFHLIMKEDGPNTWADLLAGNRTDKLWLVGEVHYEDRFGGLHTGGYARCMTACRVMEDPTFVYVADTGPFNFDRPMHPDNRKNLGKS